MARKWSGRTSGSNIPHVHVYVCEQCMTWKKGAGRPKQCIACGHLNFIHFPSIAEAKRYGQLNLELTHKLITDLKLQERFPLHAAKTSEAGITCNLTKIGEYRADFSYTRDGVRVVEDVKGNADTPLSAWKRKHAEAEYGITITIVKPT